MNYQESRKKRVSVYLDPELDEAMERIAKDENTSKGFMIRTAIAIFIQAVYKQKATQATYIQEETQNNKEDIKNVK